MIIRWQLRIIKGDLLSPISLDIQRKRLVSTSGNHFNWYYTEYNEYDINQMVSTRRNQTFSLNRDIALNFYFLLFYFYFLFCIFQESAFLEGPKFFKNFWLMTSNGRWLKFEECEYNFWIQRPFLLKIKCNCVTVMKMLREFFQNNVFLRPLKP